jgi:hypothetical protein
MQETEVGVLYREAGPWQKKVQDSIKNKREQMAWAWLEWEGICPAHSSP